MPSNLETNERAIIEALSTKACTKQHIYRTTLEVFGQFKEILLDLNENVGAKMKRLDKSVEVRYKDNGKFEAQLKFGGDILFFHMHTNVFTFPDEHAVHQSGYVKEDPLRAYCGVIQIFNFLADSIKYKRANDIGYLLGNVFINKEKHFFVEGDRQLGFLFNDLDNAIIDKVYIRAIIEAAILHAIDFDLYAPPFNEVRQISVEQKLLQTGSSIIKTGKRLGFQIEDVYKGES